MVLYTHEQVPCGSSSGLHNFSFQLSFDSVCERGLDNVPLGSISQRCRHRQSGAYSHAALEIHHWRQVYSSPAVVGGVVYIGSEDGNVYALNAANGAELWNYTTGGTVDSSPAVVGGVVYIGSDDGNVYALNAANGAKLWNYTTGGSVYSSPAVVNGVVYIGSDDDNVYALNATNGAKLWSYTTGGYVDSSPAVVSGVVYIGSMTTTFML